MKGCSCTTFGTCSLCRPPCEWVVRHIGEIPERCGDLFFTRWASTALCVSHYEQAMLAMEDELERSR